MLTYQLHTRIFAIEDGGPMTFPNAAQLKLKLGPGTAFGTEDKPSRTLVRAREATITINANTGRWFAQSRPPLEALDVTIKMPNMPSSQFLLKGDEVTYDFECESMEH